MNSHSEYSILWLFAASPRVCCANLAAGKQTPRSRADSAFRRQRWRERQARQRSAPLKILPVGVEIFRGDAAGAVDGLMRAGERHVQTGLEKLQKWNAEVFEAPGELRDSGRKWRFFSRFRPLSSIFRLLFCRAE